MYAAFESLRKSERHVIDSSSLGPETTAAAVLAGLEERRFRLVPDNQRIDGVG
jgi:hypothetical protein